MNPRLRFEILKRDGFACGYCGQRAPHVVLEVDHRTPVALGGTDDPANLVTACWACNNGKAAVPLAESRLSDTEVPAFRPRTDARYRFPPDDGSYGPPIVVDLDDPFIRSLWMQPRTFSRREAAMDVVRRTEQGESRAVRHLGKAWRWSTSKTTRFLRDIEAAGIVEVER